MNEKRAKRCRAITRWEFGKDWREVVEQTPQPRFNLLGKVVFCGQRILHPECGRAQYKQVKREHDGIRRMV